MAGGAVLSARARDVRAVDGVGAVVRPAIQGWIGVRPEAFEAQVRCRGHREDRCSQASARLWRSGYPESRRAEGASFPPLAAQAD